MTIIYQDNFDSTTVGGVPAGWTFGQSPGFNVVTAASVGLAAISGANFFAASNNGDSMLRSGDSARGNQGARMAVRVTKTNQCLATHTLRSNNNESSRTEYVFFPEWNGAGVRFTLYRWNLGVLSAALAISGYYACADGDLLHQKAFALDGAAGSCDISLWLSLGTAAPVQFMTYNDAEAGKVIATGITGIKRYGVFNAAVVDNYVATDGAGGEDVFYAADTIKPTVASAAVANGAPSIVALVMSEAMNTGFVPAASAFTVGGHTVSSVAINNNIINLTVSAPFVNGEAARQVAYTQPGTNNARDLAGNLLDNFTGQAITNNVAAGGDITAPALSSAQVLNSAPNQIVLTFNETLAALTPAAAAFAVSGGKTVLSVNRSGPQITLTCSAAYAYGDSITVTYAKPGANQIQDAAGNQTNSFGPSAVTNSIAAPGGATVTLPGVLTRSGVPLANEAGKFQFLSKTDLTAAPLANVAKTTNASGGVTAWGQAGLASGVKVRARFISDVDGLESHFDLTPN